MKDWKMLMWLLVLFVWFSGINLLAAEDQEIADDENFREDVFKIALKDDDEDDEDDDDMDDEGEDDDMDDDRLPPKNMDELWRIIFLEVDDVEPDETRNFYEENFPFVIEQAKKMLKEEPREVVELLMKEVEEYEDVWEEKEENPEQFKTWFSYKKNEYKSLALAENIRHLSRKKDKSDDDKAMIKTRTDELKTILGTLFALRLEHQKREVENLRNEIREVESHIKKRETNRDKIIERKLSQMTGKEDDLDW